MLIDHIGFLFFPQTIIFRVIGRITFPLFAFLIAEGSIKTQNINQYLKRLLVFSLISQIPYSFFIYLAGENIFQLNIFFTLAFGLLLIKFLQEKKYPIFVLFLFTFIIISTIISFDYGIYGVLLILSFYLFIKKPLAGLLALISLTLIETTFRENGQIYFQNQIFSVLALLPIVFYKGKQGTKINKWFFYWFYPVHLFILSIIYLIYKVQ